MCNQDSRWAGGGACDKTSSGGVDMVPRENLRKPGLP